MEAKQPASFTTTRPKSTLLIPSKRPLTRQPSPSSSSSSRKTTPTLIIRSLSHPKEIGNEKAKDPASTRIEVDFSAAPQPFLDPGLWERILKDAEADKNMGMDMGR
ncbi:hypothetical protein BDV06DRAFT_228245 [Aspergillus oleicola]